MYNIKPLSKQHPERLDFTEYSDFDSVCDHTMVGLVQRKNGDGFGAKNNSCFYGVQEPSSHRTTEKTDPEQKILFLDREEEQKTLQVEREEALKIIKHLKSLKNGRQLTDEQRDDVQSLQSLVNEINTGKRTWTASLKEISNQSFAQKKGLQLIQLESGEIENKEVLSMAQKYALGQTAITKEDLPQSFDWRDFQGENFVPEIKDQGACGSCYTISIITALEARTRIHYGKKLSYSPQFSLNCNFLTEGCDGGWSMFVGFFAESFGLVSEECAPYKASTSNNSCSDHSSCEIIAKVKRASPVGNFYGASSEENMMLEIRKNGPIVADFSPPMTFQMYSEGIFSDDHSEIIKHL